MAIRDGADQRQILTTATVVTFASNTSGINLGGILLTNTHPTNQINAFLAVVPSGSSMGTGNHIASNIGIGASGLLNLSIPLFMPSGSSLQASGSAPGLNAYSSYIFLN